MRKFLSSLIVGSFLASLLTVAFAGNLVNPYRYATGGAPAPATITYISEASSSANQLDYSYAGQNIGTAAGDRVLVVACLWGGTSNVVTDTAITVDGNNMTIDAEVLATNNGVMSLGHLAWPTGTTATIVCDGTGAAAGRGAVLVYNMTFSGTVDDTHTQSVTNPTACSDTITTQADGVAVGFTYSAINNNSTTWTNLTEDVDSTFSGEADQGSGASATTSGASLAITAQGSGTNVYSCIFAGYR